MAHSHFKVGKVIDVIRNADTKCLQSSLYVCMSIFVFLKYFWSYVNIFRVCINHTYGVFYSQNKFGAWLTNMKWTTRFSSEDFAWNLMKRCIFILRKSLDFFRETYLLTHSIVHVCILTIWLLAYRHEILTYSKTWIWWIVIRRTLGRFFG